MNHLKVISSGPPKIYNSVISAAGTIKLFVHDRTLTSQLLELKLKSRIELGKRWIPFNCIPYLHIYNRTNGRDDLFREVANYLYSLAKWKKYIDPVCHTIAHCLMSKDFHAMVEVKVGELLVEELASRKKLEVIKHLRGLPEVESVSSLKMILNDDYLSTTIDLEGIY